MYKHINEYNNMKYIISILSILLFSVNSLFAQDNLTAAGLVMTENGEEIIGATVTLKENPLIFTSDAMVILRFLPVIFVTSAVPPFAEVFVTV